MKISKTQLKKIIREEKAKLLSEQAQPSGHPLHHIINCYAQGLKGEECFDDMPNEVTFEMLVDFANFVMRVKNSHPKMYM